MEAVHAALYGVSTSAAGLPFTVFVVSLTIAHEFAGGSFATVIVDEAVLLAGFGSVVVEDEPTDAVFVIWSPGLPVTRAVISSVAVELGAISPIVPGSRSRTHRYLRTRLPKQR